MKNPFYPLYALTRGLFGRKTGTQSINSIQNAEPIWVDMGDAWHVFREIPHLNTVLNTKASFVSQAEITIQDTDGNIDESEFSRQALKLINNPNPLQSKSEFLYQYSVNKNLMGSSFIYKPKGIKTKQLPDLMWVIPSDAVEILTTGKLYLQTELSEIIKGYKLTVDKGSYTFETDDILFKNQGNTNDVILGEKPLESLQKSISNIAHGMGMVNVVYTKKGAIGILSTQAKNDSTGAIPLGDKERQKITDQYLKDYGTEKDQLSVILTNASMQWQHMSYPLKDLIIHEEIEQDFGHICDRFGIDRDVFSSTKGATNENKKQGQIATIQGSVKQEIDDLMLSMSNDFGLTEQGLKFVASYEHLPVMQEDQKQTQEAKRVEVSNLVTLWHEGLITRNDIRSAMSKDEVDDPEMNRYIWQTVDRGDDEISPDQQAIIEAQASLRGSVGGVTGIIGTIGAIARGEMTQEQAVSVFIEIYGFNQETSERIAGLKESEMLTAALKELKKTAENE